MLFDDEPKKRTIARDIGRDLSLIAIGELISRVGLLKAEIVGLES